MKSENARKYLDKDAVIMNNGDRMVDASIAYTAIDIAEQEAEERMRQKAVKAYCYDCCCTVVGTCGIGADDCVALRNFIQKLKDNEID